MTRQELLSAMQRETNFKRFGILLELYALEALENNEFSFCDEAMTQLRKMLSEHIVHDYYLDRRGDGAPWYIRSGNKALLTYVYCSLKEWFPEPDIGNVLRIGEKMHRGFQSVKKGGNDLDERKIKNMMSILDEKFSYSAAVFGETIPIFLILDVEPNIQDKCSLQTGCEQIYKGFAVWRHHDYILPVPRETAFLLNLSDTLFLKAWILNEDEVCCRLNPILSEIGYGWVLREKGEHLLRHMGDLVCIGLTCGTPLFKYIPFADQSGTFRRSCMKLVENLIRIASSGNRSHDKAFN